MLVQSRYKIYKYVLLKAHRKLVIVQLIISLDVEKQPRSIIASYYTFGQYPLASQPSYNPDKELTIRVLYLLTNQMLRSIWQL